MERKSSNDFAPRLCARTSFDFVSKHCSIICNGGQHSPNIFMLNKCFRVIAAIFNLQMISKCPNIVYVDNFDKKNSDLMIVNIF